MNELAYKEKQQEESEPKDDDPLITSAIAKSDPKWDSWRWQMQNRIRTIEDLRKTFPNLQISKELIEASKVFPFSITPYYASLIQGLDYSDPVFKMIVPDINELINPSFLENDPLEEEEHMPVPGLVHRYKDRALIITTSICSNNCRFCTRKRTVGVRDYFLTQEQLKPIIEYISAHEEIKDVIVSGGDPLTMPTKALEAILSQLRSIAHVEVIRIGTRVPVVMPQRIDTELTDMLKKYHPIWINTHFNHPNEITETSMDACHKIVDAGIPLGNQSVLLKGVNDDKIVMEDLLRKLVKNRIKPYYLYSCDKVIGTSHFQVPTEKGIEIMEHLRGRVSGIAIPSFIVDLPNGGGKVPLLPNYIISKNEKNITFRNFEGKIIEVAEPEI